MSPRSAGKLRSKGACRKCSSIDLNPASISLNGSGPIEIISDKADGGIVRIPSAHPVPELEHVGRVDAELAATSLALVDTATKCAWTAPGHQGWPATIPLALLAFPIVSSVVKVFELTTKMVSAASMSAVASHMSAPSTLDTKRKLQRSVRERQQEPRRPWPARGPSPRCRY